MDIIQLISAGLAVYVMFTYPVQMLGVGMAIQILKCAGSATGRKQIRRYKQSRLRTLLKRMLESRYLSLKTLPDGSSLLTLTDKGKLKLLRYNLQTMTLRKPETWNGVWHIVVYDISQFNRHEADLFRNMLKRFKMLQLQRSVYIYPYPCENEIEFLRAYLGVPEAITFIRTTDIEHASVYRKHFRL